MTVSMLIPYRNREEHLHSLSAWWRSPAASDVRGKVEVLLLESTQRDTGAEERAKEAGWRYIRAVEEGVFHKTALLNTGLAACEGDWIIPYDIDLLPVRDTLARHLEVASAHPATLIVGYRVMSSMAAVPPDQVEAEVARATIAPEDREACLRRQLETGERFGIAPVFERGRLLQVGAWDEAYVGWGAEDQDVIDRYLGSELTFLRAPDLLYLHLSHEPCAGWNDVGRVVANRDRYYARRLHGRQAGSTAD